MNKSNISNETLDQLKSIVGINNFIDDVNDMSAYLSDWRNQFHGLSPLILKPCDTEKISKILKIWSYWLGFKNIENTEQLKSSKIIENIEYIGNDSISDSYCWSNHNYCNCND